MTLPESGMFFCIPLVASLGLFRSRGLNRADHHIHRGIFLHNKSEVILFVYSFIICFPKANNLHECRHLVLFFHYMQRQGRFLLIGKELALGVSGGKAHFDLCHLGTDHRSPICGCPPFLGVCEAA